MATSFRAICDHHSIHYYCYYYCYYGYIYCYRCYYYCYYYGSPRLGVFWSHLEVVVRVHGHQFQHHLCCEDASENLEEFKGQGSGEGQDMFDSLGSFLG